MIIWMIINTILGITLLFFGLHDLKLQLNIFHQENLEYEQSKKDSPFESLKDEPKFITYGNIHYSSANNTSRVLAIGLICGGIGAFVAVLAGVIDLLFQ